MEQSGFVVVVELGTSKVTGIVARQNTQGVMTVLASETVSSDGCIKYGVIYNIDLAAGKIKKLINLLENTIGKKIGSVYVSVNGKSLRAIEHIETKVLDGDTPITVALLDKMDQLAKLDKPDFFINYSVHEPQYYIDGVLEENPVGKLASSIEARSIVVVGPPNIKSNLKRSLEDKAQVEIKSFITGAVAAGALAIDQEDRQAGCALIDFGAGTTTLSIYKDGFLKFMSVIPFGGQTVTKDIQALGFTIEAAEDYKIKYGKLGKFKKEDIEGKPNNVDLRELNKVIQLRMDEIVLNVINQIKLSGYAKDLEAGILTIGGASQLNGLNEYLEEKAQLPIKRATPKRVYINNSADLLNNPAYIQVLGLLLFANESCEYIEREPQPIQADTEPQVVPQKDETPIVDSEPQEKEKKSKKKKHGGKQGVFNFIERIQNFGGTMFSDDDDE